MAHDLPDSASVTSAMRGRDGPGAGLLWAFRVAAVLELLSLLAQAVTAGGLLGETGTGALHGVGVTFVHLFGVAVVVSGVLLWRPGRGPVWPMTVGVVVLLGGVLQSAFGGTRNVVAHVPTGVALTVVTTWLVAWALTRRPVSKGHVDD